MMTSQKEVARKLVELEKDLQDHDEQIQTIFTAIHQLMGLKEATNKKETCCLFCKGMNFGLEHERPFVKNKAATPKRVQIHVQIREGLGAFKPQEE
jgi:hypothetical protein